MARLYRGGTCAHERERRVGSNCGEFPPTESVIDHWPICTGFRGGNWLLPASLAFGPYSPDTISLNGIALDFVSADLWRSATFSRSVRVGGLEVNGVQVNGVVIGTYRYYLELAFLGAAAGEAVLTAYTVEHPDDRFPETVVWDNKLPLAESTILTLIDSTNYADAEELLPFITLGLPAPLSPYPAAHGVPMYNADGTYHSTTRQDSPRWARVTTGEVPCSHTITGTTSEVTWCVEALLENFPLFCQVGETITEHLHDATSDQSIPGTAHDGSLLGDETALRMVGEPTNCGGTGLELYELAPGRDYNTVSRLEITWEADCEGVTVTAVATIKSVYGTANYYTLTFVWEDLPFDWWESPLTQTATFTLTRPDSTTVDREITLTLTPYECDYGYYEYPELEPCFDEEMHPIFVDIAFDLVNISSGGGEPTTYEIGGTFAMPWTGTQYASDWTTLVPSSSGYEIRVIIRENTTPEIHGEPEVSCEPEGGWPGGSAPAGIAIWDVIIECRDHTGAFLFGQTLANTCVICGPDANWGMTGLYTSVPLGPHSDDAGWQVEALIEVYG